MEEKKYLDLVKEQIEHDKLISDTNPKYHDRIKQLLTKKKAVLEKNTIFANFQLNLINKKIEKIKNKK